MSIQLTKPIFRHEQKFDESSPYMKFGRNWVINESVHKCKLIGCGHLGYQTNREFDQRNRYMKFGGNGELND